MSKSMNIDFQQLQNNIARQFQNLDFKDLGAWQSIPRWTMYTVIASGVVGALWLFTISDSRQVLLIAEEKEVALRDEFKTKMNKAINLPELVKQKAQVQVYVNQLEKQLPSKAEMAALLTDINQAGIGRGLQFELFRPGQINPKEYYAELPIELKIVGKYHDLGNFASDIAHLSRIVTLNNININLVAGKESALSLESTAKTFRYLDENEINEQQKLKIKDGANPGAKP